MEIFVKFDNKTNILFVNYEDNINKIFELLKIYHNKNFIYLYSKCKILEPNKSFLYYNFNKYDCIDINYKLKGGRQKQSLHHEVLEMIMGMLNKGLLLQSNKPIEASEKNAKLVKAYIYRKVSEKNPEMGGMDKILSIKTMGDNQIINMVKKMHDLEELEESIRKHLEEKSKNKKNNL